MDLFFENLASETRDPGIRIEFFLHPSTMCFKLITNKETFDPFSLITFGKSKRATQLVCLLYRPSDAEEQPLICGFLLHPESSSMFASIRHWTAFKGMNAAPSPTLYPVLFIHPWGIPHEYLSGRQTMFYHENSKRNDTGGNISSYYGSFHTYKNVCTLFRTYSYKMSTSSTSKLVLLLVV